MQQQVCSSNSKHFREMYIVEVQKSNFDLFYQRRFFISTNDKSYNVQNDRFDDSRCHQTILCDDDDRDW